MAKFVTDASGATWWPLEPMQVAFFLLAGEITQVKEAIPWVRCASGNVSNCISQFPLLLLLIICKQFVGGQNKSSAWYLSSPTLTLLSVQI